MRSAKRNSTKSVPHETNTDLKDAQRRKALYGILTLGGAVAGLAVTHQAHALTTTTSDSPVEKIGALNELKIHLPQSYKNYLGTDLYKMVLVEGHSTSNDGGGGMYNWIPGSTLPADEGSVIASLASGIAPGQWVRLQDQQTINVLRFGADPSGRLDSSDAIQRAINHASRNGGGTVFIPSGNFLCGSSKTIELKSNITIQGAGHNSVLTLANNSPIYGSQALLIAYEQTNLEVRDIAFEGNRAYNTNLVTMVKFNNCSNILVQNCVFRNSPNNSIYASDGSSNVRMLNNVSLNSAGTSYRVAGTALKYCERVVIEGNLAYNDGSTAIQYDGFVAAKYNCRDITIANNKFFSHPKTQMSIALWFTDNVENVTISGNMIKSMYGIDASGIRIDGTFSTIKIANNIIDNVSQAIRVVGTAQGKNLSITNNQITRLPSLGIAILPKNPGLVTQVVISGNTITDNLTRQIINIAANGVSIVGNSLSHGSTTGGHAILCTGTHNVIANNRIDCNHSIARGVELYGNYNIVSGNIIQNTGGTHAIRESKSDHNTITNNILINTKGIFALNTDSSIKDNVLYA